MFYLNNKFNIILLLYSISPKLDFAIAVTTALFAQITLVSDITARTAYTITIPSIAPYANPPSLSTCFITGRSVSIFANRLINTSITLTAKNITMPEPIFTIVIVVWSITLAFTSSVAFSISLFMLSIIVDGTFSSVFSVLSSTPNVALNVVLMLSSITVFSITAFATGLYKTNATVGKVKEANAYLLYEFFEKGYALEQLPLYQRLNEAVENNGNELLIKVVHSFIKALCNENQKECDFTIDVKYQGKDSSSLYDEMYDLIMSHLDSLVTRKSGKVVYYNEQNQFGNISVYDHDPIFFRQADFAYDEEVERNIRVNYTVLPTYDSKKQRLTEKAILVTIDDSDYDFINR